MPPRQILHPDNRVICPKEEVVRPEVDRLIGLVRSYIGSSLGEMLLKECKDTSGESKANKRNLEEVLEVMSYYNKLEAKGRKNKKRHTEILHMIISEIDAENDEARAKTDR